MTIIEAWKLYERDKKYEKYSPHTLKSYKLQATLLARELGDCETGDVSYQQLKEYLYKQDHLKSSSISHRVRFIKSFFRWSVDEGHNRINPAARLKEPKLEQRVPKFLTEEDVETLRANCEAPREHAIIEFMYTTGCRIGEIVQVDVSDIDWDNNSLIVHGKGSKEREVYFNTKCRIWLKKYLETRADNESALFVTKRKYDGKPNRLSISQMRDILKEVAKRAGIDANVYPHAMRHSYATHLLNNGAPMEAIRQLLGHQKQESTEIYAHLSGQRRKEIYKRFFNT